MSIIVFILVLAVLIFVHELGHFLAAKSSGVRVDEFGIGFPPRAFSFKPKKSETRYSLNWLPLGGFVKIFGEDSSGESISGPDAERSFVNKSKLTQVWILSAGVICNVLAAWIFISIGFMLGLPASVGSYEGEFIEDKHISVTAVLPNSPAEEAGLSAGDRLLGLTRGDEYQSVVTSDDVGDFLGENISPVGIIFEREGVQETVTITPSTEIIEGRAALGIGIDEIGVVSFPVHRAFWEGGRVTFYMTGAIAVGLWDFVSSAFTGTADLSQVTGPVGLVGLVGDASKLGFTYLLSFTALISINLALINLIPFPALDGGRILFVAIEAVKGSPINPRVANTLNTIGFVLLIILMVVVTYNDIARLVTG